MTLTVKKEFVFRTKNLNYLLKQLYYFRFW